MLGQGIWAEECCVRVFDVSVRNSPVQIRLPPIGLFVQGYNRHVRMINVDPLPCA
jgi:hypothetical protein